ncbi:MAG: hypothetical protein HYS12_20120 [Planctomycetes bacterium]|nr:hypothetical protein [Planctomycetota bacterium]
MPVQEGWNIVKAALDKIYNSSEGFVYPEPLKSIMRHADERAKRTVFREPGCSLEYSVSDAKASNELAFWQVSLMFVEYVAGMLADKAGKDCHNPLHSKPCEQSRELHLQMLRAFFDDLEKLSNEMRLLLPLRPGIDRIPGSWEQPR